MACDGALRDPGGRHDVAARPASDAIAAHRPGRLAAQLLDPLLERGPPARVVLGQRGRIPGLLEPADLPSGAARAGVFGAPLRRVAANRADLRAHAQHLPLLQPAGPLDVRPLRARDVPARARAHRRRARGVGRRRVLRICAAEAAAAHPPAGAVVAVDAVRALRAAPLLHDGCARTRSAGPRWRWCCRTCRAGITSCSSRRSSVLYCLYEIADRRLWSSVRMWVVARRLRRGRGGGDVAVRQAVPHAPRARASRRARSGEVVQFLRRRALAADRRAASRVWGWLQTYPRAEGELSRASSRRCSRWRRPSSVAAGAGSGAASRRRSAKRDRVGGWCCCSPWRAVVYVSAALLVGASPAIRAGTSPASASRLDDPWKAWVPAGAGLGGGCVRALAAAPRVCARRAGTQRSASSPALALGAAVLATGPVPTLAGQPTNSAGALRAVVLARARIRRAAGPGAFGMLRHPVSAGLAGFGARALPSARQARPTRAGRAGRVVPPRIHGRADRARPRDAKVPDGASHAPSASATTLPMSIASCRRCRPARRSSSFRSAPPPGTCSACSTSRSTTGPS